MAPPARQPICLIFQGCRAATFRFDPITPFFIAAFLWHTPPPVSAEPHFGAWEVLFCPKRQNASQKWRCILGTETPVVAIDSSRDATAPFRSTPGPEPGGEAARQTLYQLPGGV